jgi:serine protease AprX
MRRTLTQLQRILTLLLSVALLAGLGGSWLPPARAANLHPLLAQLAADAPEQTVAVIVQKVTTSRQAETLVAELGGRITHDLTFINAFGAELTAGAARELAASPAVRWVSPNGPMVHSGGPDGAVNTANLLNVYNRAIRADQVWAQGYQGSSVTVAVVDSGVADHADLRAGSGSRVRASYQCRVRSSSTNNYVQICRDVNLGDGNGHGTYVAGVIGGNGAQSNGAYLGVAPRVNLINVQISTSSGTTTELDVLAGLQWIYDNRAAFNIRVVNISLNTGAPASYHVSPISAAVEILWFSGIVVVVSAGNNGTANLYPPANDPFVITVGAVDDRGTVSLSDDQVASFSAFGVTSDGFAKPDLVAPGRNIVSLLASTNSQFASERPANVVNASYFRMSGTSVSAPMVAGAAALLLQDEPNLTPDQVKRRLMATANKNWPGYNAATAGAGYLDVYAAVNGTTTQSANTGFRASQLLWTGSQPLTWSSVNWNSVNWNSASWNSVNWNSVNWNSVNWNSDYWGP